MYGQRNILPLRSGPQMRIAWCVTVAGSVLFAAPLSALAQGRDNGGQTGPRPLLPRAEEIALARSAAPAAVSDSATIYVLGARAYEAAVTGTSGAACYVSRDWIASLEPHCFDPEGAQTIMRMAMYRVERLHGGASKVEADREIADGITSGRFRLPSRPAMSYMMSAEQRLVAPDGSPVGPWRPHIMIYYPWLTARDIGFASDDTSGALSLVDAGRPVANIMIVVPDFVQVRR